MHEVLLGKSEVAFSFTHLQMMLKKIATHFQWVDPVHLCIFQQHCGVVAEKIPLSVPYTLPKVRSITRNFTSQPFDHDGHVVASGNGIPVAIMAKIKYNHQPNIFTIIYYLSCNALELAL